MSRVDLNAQRVLLAEMVKMMDDGDEPGAGSNWHIRAVAALAAQAPVQGEPVELPPLPEPRLEFNMWDAFSGDQMHDYARAAIDAARKAKP